MNKMEPIMFSQAMCHGKERGWKLKNRPTARMPKTLAIKNSVDPKKSGLQIRRSCCLTVAFWIRAANVLMLKNRVPGNCVIAASQLRSCGNHAHNLIGARVCCES